MSSIGKRSKTKGNAYERKIAKELSEWWGGNFSRVPASGGLHWADDQRVAGDIIPPPGADFPFVVECKKREGWTMDHILLNNGEIKDWWYQCVTDGRRVKLTPMLVFSRNHAKDFVMLPYFNGGEVLDVRRQLVSKGRQDWFVTNIVCKNIRDEDQVFPVVVTTLEALKEIPTEWLRDYGKFVDWDPYEEL